MCQQAQSFTATVPAVGAPAAHSSDWNLHAAPRHPVTIEDVQRVCCPDEQPSCLFLAGAIRSPDMGGSEIKALYQPHHPNKLAQSVCVARLPAAMSFALCI